MLDALVRPLLLIALVVAASGPWCLLALLRPACRDVGLAGRCADDIEPRVTRTVAAAAWIALAASPLELYLQAVDVAGGTVFSGVEPALAWQLLTGTASGWVWTGRVVLLAGLLAVLAAGPAGVGDSLEPQRGTRLRWCTALVLSAGALGSRALASHATALASQSSVAVAVDLLHRLAAASWIGLLIHVRLLLGSLRELQADTGTPLLSRVVGRITPIAIISAGILGATGLYNASRHLDSLWALVASPYGLTLVAKLLLILPVAIAGSLNFLVIRPALRGVAAARAGAGPLGRGPADLLRSLVEVEVAAGAAVLALAAVLGSVPPAVDDPVGTLTPARLADMFHPRTPPTSSPGLGPGPWPALQQTPDDYAYSVFNHAWAGAALLVMALGSFLESLRGGSLRWARSWPLVFVALAVFLFIRNDPEAWPFGPVGFLESMRIPEMVQHRLAVVLLLALGWVEHAGRTGQLGSSRWAYVFPVLCLAGGLMLFSHSHDLGVTASDTQTYIYVQHAMMGVLALLAGLCRWFQLRRHEEGRWLGRLWSLFVFLLGLQMFLFYKEM